VKEAPGGIECFRERGGERSSERGGGKKGPRKRGKKPAPTSTIGSDATDRKRRIDRNLRMLSKKKEGMEKFKVEMIALSNTTKREGEIQGKKKKRNQSDRDHCQSV